MQNISRYPVTRIIAFVTLLIMSLAASSQGTPQLIPARFGNAEGALSTLLEMPSDTAESDNVVGIACQAIVEPTGQVNNANCFYELLSERDYVREILDAAETGTVSPALVNQAPVRVLVNFSVLFVCKNSACAVYALPHHNQFSEQYGLDYFAPQVILPDNSWYAGFEDKMAVISERDGKMHTNPQLATGIESYRTTAPNFFTDRSTTSRDFDPDANQAAWFITVDVNEKGVASDARIDQSIPTVREYAEKAMEGLSAATFIPGYVMGKPAAMSFREYGVVDPSLLRVRGRDEFTE